MLKKSRTSSLMSLFGMSLMNMDSKEHLAKLLMNFRETILLFIFFSNMILFKTNLTGILYLSIQVYLDPEASCRSMTM